MYTPLDRMPYLPMTDRPQINGRTMRALPFGSLRTSNITSICRPLMENEIRGRARPIRMCRITHISITEMGRLLANAASP